MDKAGIEPWILGCKSHDHQTSAQPVEPQDNYIYVIQSLYKALRDRIVHIFLTCLTESSKKKLMSPHEDTRD